MPSPCASVQPMDAPARISLRDTRRTVLQSGLHRCDRHFPRLGRRGGARAQSDDCRVAVGSSKQKTCRASLVRGLDRATRGGEQRPHHLEISRLSRCQEPDCGRFSCRHYRGGHWEKTEGKGPRRRILFISAIWRDVWMRFAAGCIYPDTGLISSRTILSELPW